MRKLLVMVVALVITITSAACGGQPYPSLDTLDLGTVRESGARLIDLPMGLARLDTNENFSRAVVVVHGYASTGLEWVYPLLTLSGEDTATYFYRWDWTGCPTPSAQILEQKLQTTIAEQPEIQSIRMLGHSYGGVLTAIFIDTTELTLPIEANIIAAPLAGMGSSERCTYATPTTITDSIELNEWRTQHHLDGAFKDREVDPQVVEISGSHVTVLGDTYKGRRLGHNWSISAVADLLKAEQ